MLSFTNRRSSESTRTVTRSTTSHSRSHSNSNSQSHGGWGQSNQFKNGDSYTQRAVPSHPPGLGHAHGGRSARSSFSFSLRKSDSVKRPAKVQHLMNVSSIKSKGISAPLTVANGGAEPWSPLPSGLASSSIQGQADDSRIIESARDSAILIPSTPVHPPLVTFTPPKHPQQQKLRQPQPRSPPAAPGTSQKRSTGVQFEDDDGLTLPLPPQTLISSDGSLYSRNSFCSSDNGLPASATGQQVPSVPVSGGVAESLSILTSGAKGVSESSCAPVGPSYTFSSPIYSDGDTLTRGRPPSVSSPTCPSPNTYLPRLMTVIAPFTPTLDDELPLKVGDTVRIIEEYKDDWCMVQMVGRMDSPRGVVPCVCLQERKRMVPVPVNVGSSAR